MDLDGIYLEAAKGQAKKSLQEGGIPIGAALSVGRTLVALGHNRRVQAGDPILHAETDCIRRAGRLSPRQYRQATMFTTLSPCMMCSGTVLLYGIPRVVIGENANFKGAEDWLQQHGVTIEVVQDQELTEMMRDFIAAHPELWFEDIGKVD